MDGTRDLKRLKYDWVVKPGGDPNDIVVRHEGTVVEAKDDGSLSLYGRDRRNCRRYPVCITAHEQRFVEVECEYKVKHKKDGATEVRFKVGDYDEDYDLVIDPDIVFATYIGATQANWGFVALTMAIQLEVLHFGREIWELILRLLARFQLTLLLETDRLIWA